MPTASELWNQAADDPVEDATATESVDNAQVSRGAAALLEQSKEHTLGSALGEGLGGQFDVMGHEVPLIPKGLTKALARAYTIIPRLAWDITKTIAKDRGSMYGKPEQDATFMETMIGATLSALLTENTSATPEGVAAEEAKPVTTEVRRILGEEVLYFGDRQRLYEKIATNPEEVVSDIASVIAAAFTKGGSLVATRTPKLAKILQATGRIADVMDPMMAGARTASGIAKRFVPRMRKGPDADYFNPETEYAYGRDPTTGDPMTATTTPVEGAEQFGAGKEMTPDSVLNPQKSIETQEYLRGSMEGEIGAGTKHRLDATVEAIEDSKRRMAEDVSRGVDPFDAEVAGKYVLEQYQLRQLEDKVAFKQKFQTIRAHFTDEVPTGHEWRKNLDAALDELKPTQVDPDELQKVRQAVDEILENVDTRQLTLNDIDAFRTEFRQRMIKNFNQKEINVIGSGSMTQKVYNAITNDLYDAIEATVRASDGRLPDTLLTDVRRAKAEYRDLKILEDTAGGKFLIKHQENPQKLVNGLLSQQLATDEIKNVYKLIGEEAAANIQGALMHQLFQQATKGPLGLKKKIADINKNNPNRLIELFGSEERGQQIARELGAFAEFSAMTEPIRRREMGTITGRANQILQGGAIGGALTAIIDITRAMAYGDVPYVAMIGGSLFGTWAVRAGHTRWIHSEWGRRRLREGLGDTAFSDMFMNAMDKVAKRAVTKPVEVGMRTQREDYEEMGRYRPQPQQ